MGFYVNTNGSFWAESLAQWLNDKSAGSFNAFPSGAGSDAQATEALSGPKPGATEGSGGRIKARIRNLVEAPSVCLLRVYKMRFRSVHAYTNAEKPPLMSAEGVYSQNKKSCREAAHTWSMPVTLRAVT